MSEVTKARHRIAVCHPRIGLGGSEARALWLLQALRDRHDMTLLTLGTVDLPALNDYYGTSLREGEFRVSRPVLGRWLARRTAGAALRAALLRRHARARSAEFDLMISAYNPIDFGKPGVQFIADFSWLKTMRIAFDGETSPLDAPGVLNRMRSAIYGSLVRVVRGRTSSRQDVRDGDVVIANSEFTANVLAEELDMAPPRVIYPPVAGPLGGPSPSNREVVFVSLGRVSPEKRIEEQIAVLEDVRERGHALTLRICGGPLDGAYADSIRALVAARSSWVTWDGWVRGEAKWALLRESRFGIHGRVGEAFGISAAEMVRAGCLLFAPNVGGPAEIISEPRLTFRDHGDAVEKIIRVLEDLAQQESCSQAMIARGAAFEADRFMAEVRGLTRAVLQDGASGLGVGGRSRGQGIFHCRKL